MSTPNLKLLGLDDSLVRLMQMEKKNPSRVSQYNFLPSKLAEKALLAVGLNCGHTASDIPLKITDGGKFRYPLRKMGIGEHFFVPNRLGRTTEQTQNSLSSSIGHIQGVTQFRFQQRRYPLGVRVWRIL